MDVLDSVGLPNDMEEASRSAWHELRRRVPGAVLRPSVGGPIMRAFDALLDAVR